MFVLFCHESLFSSWANPFPIAKMSYAAAASVLNDREKYRSFFRVLPSFDNLAPSVVAIMDQFKWTQMLVFTQDESLFVKVSGGA